MSISRRKFLQLSAMFGGGAAGMGLLSRFPFLSALAATNKPPKSLRILILGGTGFTGPFQVKYALSRGHKVTVFNRGRTHPGELPKEVEQLLGDRNGKLDALKGRTWDVCIDNPTAFRYGSATQRKSCKEMSVAMFSFRRSRSTQIPVSSDRMRQRRSRNTPAPMR